MAINFNTDPYYDDFSESKEFYRILFKPGRAVQAREITQLQTTLQNQIARFGQNIFKEGAIVIPGQQIFDKFYNYVKIYKFSTIFIFCCWFSNSGRFV